MYVILKMKIKCKGCGYVWDYKGESEYYVSCPRCRRNIKVLKLENLGEDDGT